MSYTRDWVNTTPLDHSKFKDQPGHVRAAKVDVEERLAAFIYGFTSGETESGFKYAPFIVQGTAPSTAANQIIAHGSDVNSVCELFLADEAGNRMQMTSAGKMYLAGGGKLPNNTYMVAVDSTGTGLVNLMKCTTGNVLEIMQGAILTSTTAPTTDLQIPGKKYVDDAIATAAAAFLVSDVDTFNLSNTSTQTTTSSSAATIDYGATDYVEIVDPSSDDEIVVFFDGTYNQNSGSATSTFEIQENSSGSYAKIANSERNHRQYGDGNTKNAFFSMARITGKSSTFRISSAFSISGGATLSVYETSMQVIHIKK